MHSHAWPLYSAVKLLGTEFTPEGIKFRPRIPLDAYEFNSELLGFKKDSKGYSGWYAPSGQGHWSIQISLPEEELILLKHLTVNGVQTPLRATEGRLRFSGDSVPAMRLRWEIS